MLGKLRVLEIVSLLLFSLKLTAATHGSIQGVVRDKATAEPLFGVQVTARSPSYLGNASAVTDENGVFYLTELTLGTYEVTADAGGAISTIKGVTVIVDRTIGVEITIDTDLVKGEVYNIEAVAPHVDVAGATLGVVLGKDYLDNVPMGRSRDFSEALNQSPSANEQHFGTAFGGGTAGESTFVINGLNVTSPGLGFLNTRLPMDFVEQLELKEGGYGPEFGRATNGVVNAITKTGGNEFHGSFFFYYRPAFLQAKSKSIPSTGSLLLSSDLDYYINAGFELGGPIVKDLLWFHVGYAPEIQSNTVTRKYQWVAGTDAPTRDRFGNLVWESSPEFSDSFSGLTQSHPYTLMVTHLINNDNRHSLGVSGSPVFFDGYAAPEISFVRDYGRGSGGNGNPATFRSKVAWNGTLWSGVYNYTGKFFKDRLKIEGFLGGHQERKAEILDPESNVPFISYGSPQELRNVSFSSTPPACAASFADGTLRCPTPNGFVKQGFNYSGNQIVTRFQERLIATTLFDLAGLHQLKIGADLEQNLSSITKHSVTGTYTNWQGDFYGSRYLQGGNPVDDLGTSDASYNYSAFVGDTWNPLSSLVLNYGLRWEGQNIMGRSDPADANSLVTKMALWDNIAPRAGLIWDFTNKGRGALRFNYGRFYQSIPLSLTETVFAGQGNQNLTLPGSTCRAADGTPLNEFQVTDPLNQCTTSVTSVHSTQDFLVQPAVKGQHLDEFILGADYEIFSNWVFGITGTYRYMGAVIDNVTNDNYLTQMLVNPGDFDVSKMNEVRDQLSRTPPSDTRTIQRLDSILKYATYINNVVRAKRDNWEILFKVDKKLSDHFAINFNYLLSWSYGNYRGLDGNIPNLTYSYTNVIGTLNGTGFQRYDRRHRFKLGGYYKADLKDFNISAPLGFTIGTFMHLESGQPTDLWAIPNCINCYNGLVLPLNSGGRLPWTWNVDVNLGVFWNFSDDMALEVFASFYNLFNSQEITSVDQTFTRDGTFPMAGADLSQLKFAKTLDGQRPILINPNYGNATGFQGPPFGAQFGAKLKF